MNSAFVCFAARVLIPIQALLALHFLLRGHNLPGGGFIGGLLLGVAGVLGVLAFGAEPVRRWLRVDPSMFVGAGLLMAGVSSLVALIYCLPLFSAVWGPGVWLPIVGETKLSTVLLFDTGVFVLVFGMVMKVVLALLEDSA